jgi:hypothetical protein
MDTPAGWRGFGRKAPSGELFLLIRARGDGPKVTFYGRAG